MRVAIAGSTGVIGTALVRHLRAGGHEIVRLVRGDSLGTGAVRWNPSEGTIDGARLEGVDAVVNMAGEPLNRGRWTEEKKRRIRESREGATGLLARTLAALDRPPKVFVNQSAVGIYGDRGDEILTESASPGGGFLAGVVQAWEEATAPAAEAGIRVVCLRTGIVMTPAGGALGVVLPLYKLGLGGRLGSGRQWWSWITIDDEVGLVTHALEHDSLEGPVNATAPHPVTNAVWTSTLARVLGRPTLLPAPAFGVKLVMGRQRAEEALLSGQRALPEAAQAAGYRFRHPELEVGLRAVLDR